jgi:uncharacterized membrane protein HdeD (DUF308 family)
MEDTTTLSGPSALALVREWPSVMLIGVLTVVLGGIVLAWPQETLIVLSVIFGIQLLIFGLFRLISAFSSDTTAPWLTAFVGVVSGVAGVVVVRHPFETVAVLAVVLGVVWIIGGTIDVLSAIADTSLEHRWWSAIGGLVTLAAGIIVVSWPAPTVTVVAWIGGLYLVIYGLFIFFRAFALRKAAES